MLASVLFFALQTAAVTATAPVAPVAPATTAAAPTAVAAATPNPEQKIICKEEDTVGTRLGAHKVCMTRAQWRITTTQERDVVKHSQENYGYSHQ